jgi:hypothetical protein
LLVFFVMCGSSFEFFVGFSYFLLLLWYSSFFYISFCTSESRLGHFAPICPPKNMSIKPVSSRVRWPTWLSRNWNKKSKMKYTINYTIIEQQVYLKRTFLFLFNLYSYYMMYFLFNISKDVEKNYNKKAKIFKK